MLPRGFRYIPNFITPHQKNALISSCQSHPWCTRLRRSQQYYGIKYFQTKYEDEVLQKENSTDFYPLQDFSWLIDKIKNQLQIFPNKTSPNQVLVNKYLKKDILGFHVENVEAFGDTIVGLSVGSADYLRLVPDRQYGSLEERDKDEVKVLLEDRSIYIMQGQARLKWKHGIGRIFEGKPFKSESFCRTSFTFRDVIETRRKL